MNHETKHPLISAETGLG